MDEIPALAMQRVAAGRAKCKRSTKKSCSFTIHFNFVQILKLKCFNLKTGLLFQVMLVPWWGVRKRKNWNEVRRVAKVSNKFLVVILFFIEHFNHNINLILSFF